MRGIVLKLCALAVVGAVAWVALGDASAQSDDRRTVRTKPAVNCHAMQPVLQAYKDAVIVACPQTRGDPAKATATDEFTVEIALKNGTRMEVVATRTKVLGIAKRVSSHNDSWESKTSSSRPGMALLFWVFAFASVGGALFVITRRNLIAAVMGMVGSFIGISAVYMMLYAHFLSVIQMLVYAGAIMVLFVFVIMILNRPEDEPVAPSGRAGQAIGGLAIAYLVGRLIMMLIHVQPPNPNAGEPPAGIKLPPIGEAIPEVADWGSVKSVGMDLFGPGLFPFEAISILLLVAVVGAIAIARPLHKDDNETGEAHE